MSVAKVADYYKEAWLDLANRISKANKFLDKVFEKEVTATAYYYLKNLLNQNLVVPADTSGQKGTENDKEGE